MCDKRKTNCDIYHIGSHVFHILVYKHITHCFSHTKKHVHNFHTAKKTRPATVATTRFFVTEGAAFGVRLSQTKKHLDGRASAALQSELTVLAQDLRRRCRRFGKTYYSTEIFEWIDGSRRRLGAVLANNQKIAR